MSAPGNGWELREPALWQLESGRLCYTALAVAGAPLDVRALRPRAQSPVAYSVSVVASGTPFDDGGAPVARLIGTAIVDEPGHPANGFELSLGFDFDRQWLSMIGAGQIVDSVALAGVRVEPDTPVRLTLEVTGRFAFGYLHRLDGERLATAQWFMPFEPVAGRIGIAGGSGGRVCFDDFEVRAARRWAPVVEVLSATVSEARPNDIRLELLTNTGTFDTRGTTDGWHVTVDGIERTVDRVSQVANLLLVHFEGPRIVGRNEITVAYDHRFGDVHDAAVPVPRPLDSFGAFDVDNRTLPGSELFAARAEVVDPWSVDLVFNPNAALPAAVEPGSDPASNPVRVFAAGRERPIRRALALPDRPERLRLALSVPIAPGDSVRIAYAPGEVSGRVVDAEGEALVFGPRDLEVQNALVPVGDFEPVSDAFESVGADRPEGWRVTPPVNWTVVNGSVFHVPEVFDPAPMMRRAAHGLLPDEAPDEWADVEIAFEFGLAPQSDDGFVSAGAVVRVSEFGGYRSIYALEPNGTTALVIERFDGGAPIRLASVPVSRLESTRTYGFEMRVVGAMLVAEIRDEAQVLARAQAVDSRAALPTGEVGVSAGGAGITRFDNIVIRPPVELESRAVIASATVGNHDPSVMWIDISAAAPLLYAEVGGFRVRDGERELDVLGLVGDGGLPAETLIFPPAMPSQSESGSESYRFGLVVDFDRAVGPLAVDYDPAAGIVVDASEVPQSLGPVDALPVHRRSPPLLREIIPYGPNIFRVDFDVAEPPLRIVGDGGLEAWVTHPVIGPEPVRWQIAAVWLDPQGDPDALYFATWEDVRVGAALELELHPTNEDQITDRLDDPAVPFDHHLVADHRSIFQSETRQTEFVGTWPQDGDARWTLYPSGRWRLDEALTAATGGPGAGDAFALAPPEFAAADVVVTADFRIPEPAFEWQPIGAPRVVVRTFRPDFWLGCIVEDSGAGPGLTCGNQLPGWESWRYDSCRYAFESPDGEMRYDWRAHVGEPHRLTVKVEGARLRAELYQLLADETPQLVAAVEVPDIDSSFPSYRAPVGLPGVSATTDGAVDFLRFEVRPLADDDFAPLDPAWASAGECR